MKIVYVMLAAVVLLLGGAIVAVTLANPMSVPEPKAEAQVRAGFHFVMIAEGSDESFYLSVQEGANKAASEFGAVVETQGLWLADEASLIDYLAAMIDAKVDGIALQVTSEEMCAPLVALARERGIPIIVFESDTQLLINTPTIGSNSFQIGSVAGELAIEAADGKAEVAIILSSSAGAEASRSLLVAGMADVFAKYPDMHIIAKADKKTGMVFGASEVTKTLLNEHPEVDLIIATNEKDTLGVVDVVVDANRVGSITIIGNGTLPETMDYIRRGVIYGTVASDPAKIGYESIKALVDIRQFGFTSNYLDTGVYRYTAKNVDEYSNPGRAYDPTQ